MLFVAIDSLLGWLIRSTVTLCLLVPAAWAFDITDDRGVSVHFSRPPQRIVSLLPSLTETVCELGQCQRLVGVDHYSNYPDKVAQLQQVGDGFDPNVEAIVALHPDVVLMSKQTRVGERLQSLGLKVVVLETQTHADVKRVLQKVGQMLAVPDALRIWRAIQDAMLAAARPLQGRTPRVYFEVHSAPFAAGESSFIGETLQGLGAKNIVPAPLGPFPKLNPEYVVRANPDVIIVGDRNFTGLAGRPGWDRIRAVQQGRVCVLNVAQIDVVVRPGPRMAEGARILAKCLLEK